jgi:CheY-like chemotaxis protein
MKKVYKALIVDDDTTSIYLTKIIVEKAGITHQIYTAENGQEALEVIETSFLEGHEGQNASWPELILLDINMPVMNGFEFLEAFDQRWGLNPDITKIYLLTSSTDPKDVEKAKQYALAGYIEKPLTLVKLINLGL